MAKDKMNIPQIRFKGFEGEWEEKALDKVATIVGGGTPDTKVAEYWNGDINWFSPAEIGKCIYAENSTRKITKLGLQKSSAKILPAMKTILFTSRASIGDMAILKVDACTNQGFQSLIVKNGFDVYFVYSMGGSIKKQALRIASGSTFLEISGKALGRLIQCYPVLKEQTQIGNFFQRIDKLIELQTRAVESAETYKKAMLQKMFPQKGEKVPRVRFAGFSGDWEEILLDKVADIQTGKLDANAMKTDGEYDFYTSGIQKYKIDVPAFEGPAIIIAGNGATVGYLHYADGLFNAYQRTYVLTNLKVNRFFLYSIISKELPRKIHQEVRAGSIPYIVMSMLTELQLYFPETEEQTAIGNFFQKLDQQIEQQAQKLATYQQLKKAMLQRMFV